ncbi:response regulator [Pseudomonas sp. Irchel s3b2]|uniref:response regulator n=1 Tax=Pseudomonas sp. Irchel s3b2 TaxID=2009073 RepID=UPI000BA41C36|nr:response regulator [Pseudomonas sp. Irchel s3b2]
MNLKQTAKHLDLPHSGARDDMPASHGHGSNKALRIILADDHPVVLMGAEMALGNTFSIVAQAHSADELINHLQRTPCDLLISDYSMPSGQFPDGLKLMNYVKRHFRQLPVIVMTMLSNPTIHQALLKLGIDGLFDKRSSLCDLKRSVHDVIKGRRFVSPAFAQGLQAQTLSGQEDVCAANLSEREVEVVRLFVQGLSGRQIAAHFNRSEKTISRQKRTAMDKLGLGHDGGLIEFARVNGLAL